MTTVWTVKGGRHGEREELMLGEGLLGGGWDALGSLESINSKDELAEVYRRAYPDSSERPSHLPGILPSEYVTTRTNEDAGRLCRSTGWARSR